ncbi:MAG: ubiquinone biosynthesis regulatory protein kinase UbiB [Gammaproteobacteria bacterium]|nr:ubiquinone biosynthesis regulatory protein kinase UbiB [Gammaproteobacteria bacterium]
MRLAVLGRLIAIQRVLVRHGLDDFVRATHLYRPLRFLFFLSPWTWFQRRRGAGRAERLRLALEELGPIFVKFGQAVSTRRDLLPPDIADELAKLQDRVPPFPGAVARAAIEASLGQPVTELFATFDEQPLAAASIAQVHVARLRDGREAVVKVLRPGMRAVIGRDLEVLYALAGLAERWSEIARRLKASEIVHEYQKTILDELDLMREAANASQLRRNFAGSRLLYVPEIHWDLCRTDVMVMERIRGVPIGELAALRRSGVDFRRLAENGVEIFFTQVFHHNFFHADMHPGNIFVLTADPAQPRYAAVDFGIVGTLDLRDQRYLAENFLAVFDRDYRRVAELHLESGWVPAGSRVDEMESAIRTICEPIFDKPLMQISFGTVLLRLFEALRRFDGQIQPQLILLQKTLLNVEGLGRQLYPELDIWKTAGPILRNWMRQRMSPRTVLRELRRGLPDAIEVGKALPAFAKRLVEGAQDRDFHLPIDLRAIDELRAQLVAGDRRRDRLLLGGLLILGSVLWLGLGLRFTWAGWAGLAAGALVTLSSMRLAPGALPRTSTSPLARHQR